MSARENGGPAFPQHVAPAYRQEPEIWGMTLRDYFAAQAMASVIPSSGTFLGETRADFAEIIAADAYRIADAMLAERSKA